MVRRALPSQVRDINDAIDDNDEDDSYFLMEHLFNPQQWPCEIVILLIYK